jgi:tRNA(fMet)-specific endonuclease VapC
MYLLDSDHLSILQRQRGPEFEALSKRCLDLKGEDFFVSIISFHEQFNG